MHMQIKGTITYVNLVDGFWGIQGDDGMQYQPVGALPANFQQEGLRIQAQVSPHQDFSIFMWGQSVKVKKIELLQEK